MKDSFCRTTTLLDGMRIHLLASPGAESLRPYQFEDGAL